MLIIPAIDLMNGQVVRLRQGKKDAKTSYFADPVEPALNFIAAGAKIIHVVDLDGAFSGQPKNFSSLKRILAAVSGEAFIELGGGMRSMAQIESALEAGVFRVVLGTAIIREPALLRDAITLFGAEKIVAGIDASGGKVAIKGWEELSNKSAMEVAQEVAANGAKRIIYTDIATDGMLTGPNISALKEIASSGLQVIASGGIAELEHVRAVAALQSHGIEAMIIGKAIYDGKIKLTEAIACSAVAEPENPEEPGKSGVQC